MAETQLTDGSPVPEDGSHTEIEAATGMQKGYVVLTEQERAKGFVKPLRRSYFHNRCRSVTTMGFAIAETYARNPSFYRGTFCCACKDHFKLAEFQWEDGEPMDPLRQPAWAEGDKARRRATQERVVADLEKRLAEARTKLETL